MSEKKIVFNSSLPRSGSTLLQNILAQNPRFYCSPTSGLIEMLSASRATFNALPEFKAQDPEQMRIAFTEYCRGALNGYYKLLTDKPVCCDKSRGWIHNYRWLETFHPSPKILCCVRDLRAILSSMEKLYRKDPHLTDPHDVVMKLNMVTVDARVAHWLNGAPVGLSTLMLINAIQTGTYRHCHFIRFEDLTSHPAKTMEKVYEYLEEPYFEHDFDHVEQTTQEDDSQYPIYGDHKIRSQVRPIKPDYDQVLGKELSNRIVADNALFYQTFYASKAR